MSFRSFDDALNWVRKNGRDYCRPCDELKIVPDGKDWKVAIRFKSSGLFIAYAS